MSGPPAGAAGPSSVPPSRPVPPRARRSWGERFRAFLAGLFPSDTDEPPTRTGFASDSRRDWIFLLLSLGIGLGFAILWVWVVRAAPIPPGGDPSTWMLTSYPFVGLPATSLVQPFAYPPLAFPFVGLSVIIGHGPLNGGRIFMAASIFVLGYATYMLGRTVLERPSLALLAEGLWLAEPDFQQLYYFGGYPNIFSLIFLVFAVAFLVRFLRTRRPSHLFLFWVSAAVCLLSHSLTGVILVGILAMLALGLLAVERLPRTLVLSRAGAAGAAILAVSVGAYYIGTAVAGITHATYFATTSASVSKSSLLPTVLRPLYLTVPAGWVTGHSVTMTSGVALVVLFGMALAILAVLLSLWVVRRHWLTTPWLMLASWVLTICAAALAAYYLSIPVDYRRFPYFLYGPVILAVLFPLDWGISTAMSRDWARSPKAGSAPLSAEEEARLARRRRRRRLTVDPILSAAGIVVLVVLANYYTVPSGNGYEAFYTLYAHDASFLSVMNNITDSGIDGNIVATTAYVAHWPSTLTNTRITYVPALSGGNAYVQSHVITGETTSMTLAGRYTVTNTLVGATVSGFAAGDFNSSPVYGTFNSNVYQPLLQLPASSIVVGEVNQTPIVVAPLGAAAPPLGVIAGGAGYQFSWPEPGFVVTENVTALPSLPTVQVQLTARANLTAPNLAFLQARVTTLSLIPGNVTNSSTPGGFTWSSTTRNGNFTTDGVVAPASALLGVTAFNSSPGAVPTAILHQNASTSLGSPLLSFQLTLTTEEANNILSSIGPIIDSRAVWSGWDVRFILYNVQLVSSRLVSPAYLQTEYGAALFAASGTWSVYLLPGP